MANIFAQRKNPKSVFTQEIQNQLMLPFLLRPLEQLHVCQYRDTALFSPFDQRRSPEVPSLDPNEDICVKLPVHGVGLPRKEISFILCPLASPTRRGLRGARSGQIFEEIDEEAWK
jgi:hypothetical protein